MDSQPNQRVMVIACSLMVMVSMVLFNLTLIWSSEQQYKQAQNYIERQEWTRADRVLKEIPDYKEAKVLRSYVQARMFLQEGQGQRQVAKDKFLAEIPTDYKGPFATDIRQLQQEFLGK